MSVTESIVNMLIGRRETLKRSREEMLTRLEHLLYLDAKGEKLPKGADREVENIITELDLSGEVVGTMAAEIKTLVEREAGIVKAEAAQVKARELEPQLDAYAAETKRIVDERNEVQARMHAEFVRVLDSARTYQLPAPFDARYPGAKIEPPKPGEPRRSPLPIPERTNFGAGGESDHLPEPIDYGHPAEPRLPKKRYAI